MKNHCIKCSVCGIILENKQKKFCSQKCRNNSTNFKHQNYICQQKRGLDRKIQLVNNHGGKCSFCGYNKNYSSLCFHHMNPKDKKFNLDLRHCSNRSMKLLIEEANKCILLCQNCHNELHNPNLSIH